MPSNSTATPKMQFKKRQIAQESRPDAPEGGWDIIIPKGKCKPQVTPAEKGGDPFILIALKLDKADEEPNATFQGSVITQRLTFYDQADPERRKAANANLRFATGLAEALDLELKEVYPDVVESEEDLTTVINAIEGKRFHGWTVHRKSVMGNGEEVLNIDVRFKKPGAGLIGKDVEDDADDERPGKRKAASGKARR